MTEALVFFLAAVGVVGVADVLFFHGRIGVAASSHVPWH